MAYDLEPVSLSAAQRAELATRKVTCPFLGAAVASGALAVRHSTTQPLASLDDVAALGNTGPGSNLGELLRMFAKGNHAFMPGASGRLDQPCPEAAFSLDLPGSQGSHAGHSGMLQGDPKAIDSGRFSAEAFERLLQHAEDGHVRRSALGRFIADNVARDPDAHAPGLGTALLLGKDLISLAESAVAALRNRALGTHEPGAEREVFTRLTRLLGESHLIGSAGEFGLLAAFLARSPGTKKLDAALGSEPAYAVADLTAMFREQRLPDGWQSWPKTILDWAVSTAAIAAAAELAYLRR
jgi:hypothetical protein